MPYLRFWTVGKRWRCVLKGRKLCNLYIEWMLMSFAIHSMSQSLRSVFFKQWRYYNFMANSLKSLWACVMYKYKWMRTGFGYGMCSSYANQFVFVLVGLGNWSNLWIRTTISKLFKLLFRQKLFPFLIFYFVFV